MEQPGAVNEVIASPAPHTADQTSACGIRVLWYVRAFAAGVLGFRLHTIQMTRAREEMLNGLVCGSVCWSAGVSDPQNTDE